MEQRFYDEYAAIQDRHWWFTGRRRILGAVLEAELVDPKGGARRILDVGCGTGAMLGELGRFGHVRGVDTEPAAVESCRRRGLDTVALASEGVLPFADSSFDLVTLLDVIEHVEDDLALLAEAGRVLRPGAPLLVTVPAYAWMWGEQDLISHHFRRYSRPRLRETLRCAGFEVRRASYFNTVLFPAIAAIRLARRLRPAGGEQEARSDFELNRPGALNSTLARMFAAEAAVIRRTNLPFGVSILALAEKR